MEAGDPTVGPEIRARACACLGADFRMQVYAERTPMIFDAAHARIVEHILASRHPRWRAIVEAPLPGPGRRSSDIRLDDASDLVLFEVETHVRRAEEIVREVHSKRDAVATLGEPVRKVHVVLALPPTRHHQQLVRSLPSTVRAAFPTPSSALRQALESETLPWPGDGILWVAGS
jgi:hypothetical protein